MSFLIGNVEQTNVSENILAAMNQTNAHVFGVYFPYGSDGSQWTGKRLYSSKNLRFIPANLNAAGTAFTAGLDDFANYAPFHQRICAMHYDSTEDAQVVIGYQDEMTADEWANAITPDDVNVMVEFPKFWYCRPQKYEFVISDTPIEGFLPSPMHWRNGVLHDYAYVSRYILSFSSDQSTYYSRSGKRGLYQYQQESIGTTGFNSQTATVCTSQIHRNKLRPYKWYCLDYAGYCSIMMLGLVKYGTTNFQALVGGGQFITVTSSTQILSTGTMDNSPNLDAGTPAGYTNAVLSFGIENLWGHEWKSTEGILQSGAYLYINTDIENIDSWPDSSLGGWTKVSAAMSTNSSTTNKTWYHETDAVYPSDCLFALWPATSSTNNTAARFPYSGQYYAAGTNAAPKKIYTGGTADFAAGGCGPFSFNASAGLSYAYWDDGCLGFALSRVSSSSP